MTNVLTQIRLNNLQNQIETADFPQGLLPVPYDRTLDGGSKNLTNGLYAATLNLFPTQIDTETGIVLNITSDLDFKTQQSGGTSTAQNLKNVGNIKISDKLSLQNYVDYTSSYQLLQVKDLQNDQGWGTIYDSYYNTPPGYIEPLPVVNFKAPDFPSTAFPNMTFPLNAEWTTGGYFITPLFAVIPPAGVTQTFNSYSLQMEFFSIVFADTFPADCFLWLSPTTPTAYTPNNYVFRHGVSIFNGPTSVINEPITFNNLILTADVDNSLKCSIWFVCLGCPVPPGTPGAVIPTSFGMTGILATGTNFNLVPPSGITIEKV